MANTFNVPSEALATLPKGTVFRLKESTNGRPIDVKRPDGSPDWDAGTFNAALADGTLPKARYIIRPVVSGKVSSKRLSLDLSMSEESTTIDTGGGPGSEAIAAQPAVQGYFVQEVVVNALVQGYQDEKQECRELRETIAEKDEEIFNLRLRVADLEHKLERAADNDSLQVVFNKAAVNFLGGPGGVMLAGKLLGHGDTASSVGEALKAATGEKKAA